MRPHRCLTILLALPMTLATAGAAAAEPQAGSAKAAPAEGLQWLDWILIAIYASATIGLGVYYARRQKNTQEYFVGSGNMNPLLIGVSLFATLLSTISYLSMPGEALGKGPMYMTSMLSLPLAFLIVSFLLIPVYMKQKVTSAYELLEVRLGLGVRLLGAAMFLLLRLAWMALLVFLSAEAMTVMMGVDESYIPLIAAATGAVAVIYTSLGGLRAVVITDFMQTVLLFGGALLVIVTVTLSLGGFDWFPTRWDPNWDTQPFFSSDPKTRVTVVGAILTALVWQVCTAGGDQTSVQRFMATRDARAARRAYATQLSVQVLVGVTLGIVGFALLGYYQAHAAALPSDLSLKDDADKIFPQFIAYELPMGVSGLVVAAMFAAAMSSIDSGVNSITAVVMTDFLDRLGLRPKTERGHVIAAKFLALTIGAIVVATSTLMDFVPGNITAVTQKTSNLLTTPIFALFFFALFVPFARPVGVFCGAIFGTLTAALIAFSGPLVVLLADYGVDPATFGVKITPDEVDGELILTAQDPISFQWIGPVALLVNVAVGTLVSLLLPEKSRPPDGTLRD